MSRYSNTRLLMLAAVLVSPGVLAYPNTGTGTISGYSGRPADASCTAGCHYGGAYTSSAPSVTGSTTVQAGSLNNAYTLTFTTNAPQAGFNLGVARDSDSAHIAGLGTADAKVQAVGTDELAHNAPTVTAAGSVSWTFNWDAPATAGAYTFYVCANPVNGNRNGNEADGIGEDGDGPQQCGTKAITVNAQPVISAVADQAISEDGTTGALAFTVSDSETAAASLSVTRASSNTTLVPTVNVVLGGSGTNRTVTVTPAANQSGSATITLTVTDASGGTGVDSFVVTVSAVNDAPGISGVDSIASYTENGAAVIVDSAVTIADIDSLSLNQATVSITGNFASGEDVLVCPSPAITGISCAYAAGTLTLSGTATLANYELAIEDVGYQNTSDNPSTTTRTLSFVVRDTGNLSSAADPTTLTVSAVNDAPVAVADAAGIAKNSSANTLDVLANDTDAENDSLTITAVTTPSAGGGVSIQGSAPNQSLSYTPLTNYSGVETFDYTISDGALTSTVTVTATVSTGSAPVAGADSPAAVGEDSSGNVFDVLANDTDADVGDTLTVTQVNGSGTFPVTTTHGSVSRSGAGPGNALLYTPVADYAGSDSFTYTVEDAAGLTASATVSVTVSAVNDAPAITAPASIGVTEDVASALTGISFADVDAASGTVVATLSVGSGTLTAASGSGVTVGGTAVARTLSGTIANLNSFIAASGVSYTTASNSTATVTLSLALSDGGNTGSGGTLSATPASVSLTVTAVNDAPQITSTAVTAVDDGQAYSYALAVTDADDTSFNFGLSGEPAGMAISGTGVITWTPPCATSLAGYTTGTITVSAADGGENGAAPATQSFTVTVAAPDSDGDGMPNCYEVSKSFDPNNAADGAQDRDGDGRSNVDEFIAGSDPDVDDVLPVVTAPASLVVSATGYLTAVDLGSASASDTLDGALEASVDNAGPFRPGRYTLTWTAQDAAGNVASDTQQVDVLPLASFSVDQVVGEGTTANVTISLNGAPPQYPVTLNYTVGGTAGGSDSDAVSGAVTLNSPSVSSTLPVAIANDGLAEGAETVVFTMTAADQAAPGTRATHTLVIADGNAPPAVVLSAVQGALPRQFAYQSDGTMTVTADAVDPNGDPLTYDWSGSDDALGLDAQAGSVVSFDPSALAAGSYTLRLSVADPSSAAAEALLLVRVMAGTSTDADLDADGILDSADAVLDYPAVLENQAGDPATAELLETEPNLALRRGRTAIAAGRSGTLIAMSDLVTFGVGGGGLAYGADSYDNAGGLFDFEIHGVPAGGSAQVVLPLQTAIRAGAVYRKFDAASGWHAFVADAGNAVDSAFSTLGQCPGPAGGEYAAGLRPFADCVRLTLQDGGPNDADGVADGVIRDPGGVADAGGAANGGATVDGGAWTAFALLLAPLWRRRRRAARVLPLALLLLAAPARADNHRGIHFGGELGSGYDSNVGNAENERDIRESSVVNGGLNASYQHELSLYSTLLLRGTLAGEYYRSFEDLSNGKAAGLARLMYRADGDFFTPVLAAWVSAAYWEFGSAIRDSDEYRAGVSASQQITTRLSMRLALGGSLRESESRVFDTKGASASLSADWRAAHGATLYAGYQFYRGDVVSTATTPGAFKIVQAAEAIEADDAFGGFATSQNAYRLDADAHIGTLGLNYALSPRLSADAQGQYIDTRADYGNEYQRVVAVLSLLARF